MKVRGKAVQEKTGWGSMPRRRFLRDAAIGGVALGAAALIGCGDDDDDDDDDDAGTASPTGTTTATATTPPVDAGTLRTDGGPPPDATINVGNISHFLPYSATNVHPYFTDNSTGFNTILGKYWYESIVQIDFEGIPGSSPDWRTRYEIIPWIADSWELQPDGVTYVFTIRPGVKFHDGSTLTADDVAFSYAFAYEDDAIPTSIERKLEAPGVTEVADSSTFKVVFFESDADALEAVSGGISARSIMSKTFGDGGGDFTNEVVGTGPFRLIEYEGDVAAKAVRFEDYWRGGGRPYLAGANLQLTVDDTTQSAAFVAGEADIMTRNDRKQAEPLLNAVPDANFETFPGNIYGPLMNLNSKPFDDLRVRMAIHLAMDREQLDALVNFGDGLIGGPLFVAERPGWSIPRDELLASPGYRYPKDADIAEAKKMLAAAGVGDGFDSSLTYHQNFAISPAYAEALQGHLKQQLSIDLKLIGQDNATAGETQRSGDFDIFINLSGSTHQPGPTANNTYLSTEVTPMAAGFNDPEMDRLITAQKVEFDLEARGELFQQIERLLLELAWNPKISANTIWAITQPWIFNWRHNHSSRASIMNPSSIWMDLDAAPSNRA